MAERIFVPFEGEGSGVEELTWGQQQIWAAMRDQGSSLNNGGVEPVPDGRTVEDLAADLSFIVSRNQSFRTRLRLNADGRPQQVVARSGEVPMEIVDAGDADPADIAGVIFDGYVKTNFDYANEWPIRQAVVLRGGVPALLVAVVCHLVIDGFGFAALLADLAARDPVTGLATGPPAPMQPLEQARWQRTQAARRQSAAALRYWERQLRAIPAPRFAESADKREPRYWQAYYDSPATDLAARMVAARTQLDTSPVLLAAFAVALARVTGNNPVVTQVVVSNRFRPGFAATVSPLTQVGLCVIDVAGITFDQAVARAWRSALGAYKHAYYDPARLDQLVAMAGRDWREDVLSCYVNDRRVLHRPEMGDPVPTEQELRAALPRSKLRWGYRRDQPDAKLFFFVNDVPDTGSYELCVDTHFMSPADLEACLLGLEAAVVGAAFDPAAVTGISPVRATA